MRIIILSILIMCALNFSIVKDIRHTWRNGKTYEGFKTAARKTMRSILKGVVALGFFALLLSQFKFIRSLGYIHISMAKIEEIRDVLELIFGSYSVYRSIEFLMCVALLFIELCLIFSFVGFLIAKAFVFPYVQTCSRMDQVNAQTSNQKENNPRAERKIFLNFASLRI